MFAKRLGQVARRSRSATYERIIENVTVKMGGMEERVHVFVRWSIEDKLEEVPWHAVLKMFEVEDGTLYDESVVDEVLPSFIMHQRKRKPEVERGEAVVLDSFVESGLCPLWRVRMSSGAWVDLEGGRSTL